MADQPTIRPPPGVVANLTDPESRERYDVLVQTICFTLSTLLVSIRIYTKTIVLRSPGWDDYVSVLAWLGLMIYMILSLEEGHYGNGKHLWDVTLSDAQTYAQLSYVSDVLYAPIIFTTKLSILLLYLRIFRPARELYLFIQLLLWANLLFYTAGFFFEIFQCSPVRKAWDVTYIAPGKCLNQRVAALVSAIINTVSDIAILLLPMGTVWELQIPIKKKLGTLAIFCTGLFGCIASITRMSIIIRNEHMVDYTWDTFPLGLWTTAEIASGIICGCLPAFPAFVKHIQQKLAVRSKKGSSATSLGPVSNGVGGKGGIGGTKSQAALNADRAGELRRKEAAWEELDDAQEEV